ncbi:ROK family protein, partial [Aerococcus sp. L_4]
MGRRGSAVIFVNKSRELLGLAPGDGEEVFQVLEKGTNPEVTALFDQYCQDIVYIVHTLQISLDLDRVVLGGGISA